MVSKEFLNCSMLSPKDSWMLYLRILKTYLKRKQLRTETKALQTSTYKIMSSLDSQTTKYTNQTRPSGNC
uniref:Uncharacterized protein n=1 Tax=Solanum tuberosum TaxID=4113 RepID=M1ASX1_SOLTU